MLHRNARRKLVDLGGSANLSRMSRRSERRKSARARKAAPRRGKWVMRTLSILLACVILAGFGVYFWLKSYLHSDDFRVFISGVVGDALGADARFELFEWQGMDARTAGFVSENGGVVRGIRADGVRASVGLGGIRRGVWEISGVRVNQLDLLLDTVAQAEPPGGGPVDKPAGGDAPAGPGLFSGLLPDRAELDSVEVASASVRLHTARGGLHMQDVGARIDASPSGGAYDVRLSGGMIDTDWFGSRIDLVSAHGKWRDGRIFLSGSEARVYERGQLTLNGELEGGDFGFYGTLTGVRAEELVPPDWQKRVMGDVGARFKVLSGEADTVLRGKVQVKNGVLTTLPVLDSIAAYANTRRFRRLVLSEATFKFWKEGDRLDVRDIVLASEGLVRVVGNMTVRGDRLDGRFRVGIVPGTLSHIPGAETKVFLRGEKGMLWAPLHITGTLDDPEEDLTGRMLAAAGERMFELVPETGRMALKFAHDSAVELPAKAVDATGKILDGDPAGAVGEGADILRKGVGGVIDLIPGAGSAPRPPRQLPDAPEDETGEGD